MTNTRSRQNRNTTTNRRSCNRRSVSSHVVRSNNNLKLYSLGMVENKGVYKIVDALLYQPVNQFQAVWKKVDSRNVSRALNRGALVIK